MKSILLSISIIFSLNIYSQQQHPCMADVLKFCKEVKDNRKEVAKCMKEHEAQLSPACKERAAKVEKKLKEFKESCKEDAKKLCSQEKPGKGVIVKCLKTNLDKLSDNCKGQFKK